MYAVIKTGGKQHKVQAGDVIEVEKLLGPDETADLHAAARRRRRGEDLRRRCRVQGDGDGQGRRRGEGRQGQGREVPAQDRLLEEDRPSAAVHVARDLRRQPRLTRALVAWRTYGTQEGRRLVSQRPRFQRQASRDEGLRRPGGHRGLDHRAPARHPIHPGEGVGKGGDDTLFAMRPGHRDLPASLAAASSRSSSRSRPNRRSRARRPRPRGSPASTLSPSARARSRRSPGSSRSHAVACVWKPASARGCRTISVGGASPGCGPAGASGGGFDR